MNEISDETLKKLVQSNNVAVRANSIRNNILSLDIIKTIIQGKHVDSVNQLLVDKKMELDDVTFGFILKNKKKKGYDFSFKVWINDNFKKKWIKKFITYQLTIEKSPVFVFKALEDDRFFSSDSEWLDLYNFIRSLLPLNDEAQSKSNWIMFWLSFFKYPKTNYSPEIILYILNDVGYDLFDKQFNLGEKIFDEILDRQTNITDEILSKMFEISKSDKFLPSNAKDIFIF